MSNKPKRYEELERLAEICPSPFYWADTNCVIVGVNEHCFDLSDDTLYKNLIGKSAYDLYTPETAVIVENHSRMVMHQGKTLIFEEELIDLKTKEKRYYISLRAPLFEDGKVIGVVGNITDITAQKEAERLKIENEKQKLENERYKLIMKEQEKFREKADRVVHDIRSPLASLLMLAACCAHLEEDDREVLRASCERLQDIANDLLRDYTPQKAQIHDFVKPTLVSTVLLEILSEKRSQYTKSQIRFAHEFDYDSSFAFININRSDFSRAISNIINNAVDALEDREDGAISLTLDSTEDSVIINIEDNGSGMPAEIVNKLLNNIAITTGKDEGHGIGFTQVYDTLKTSNGKLDINSQLGHGTNIILTFPRIPAPEWIAEKISLTRRDIIVIVDDDPSIHGAWDRKLKIILKQAPDILVEHFTSCRKALRFIESLTEVAKQDVLLLIDYEFIKEEGTTGLDFIKQSGIKRSLLVTGFYGKDKIRKSAIEAHTKILPKTLAPWILTTFEEAEHNVQQKRVDLVLVDDDKAFIQDFVGINCKNKIIDRFYDPEEFLSKVIYYPKNTKIYIDNIFPNTDVDGIDIAQSLYVQGYTNIFVITGKPLTKKVPSYINLISKEDVEELTTNLQ